MPEEPAIQIGQKSKATPQSHVVHVGDKRYQIWHRRGDRVGIAADGTVEIVYMHGGTAIGRTPAVESEARDAGRATRRQTLREAHVDAARAKRKGELLDLVAKLSAKKKNGPLVRDKFAEIDNSPNPQDVTVTEEEVQ